MCSAWRCNLLFIIVLSACLRALHVAINSVTIYWLSLKIVRKLSDDLLALYVLEEAVFACIRRYK
jgi:hypothetical protein